MQGRIKVSIRESANCNNIEFINYNISAKLLNHEQLYCYI